MKNGTDFNDLAQPEATRRAVAAGALPRQLRFQVIAIADIKPVLHGRWLIKHLLPASGLAVVYGAPGSGKSFVALDASLHIAMGLDWAGKKVRQSGVIYIAAEGGEGFANRVVAVRQKLSAPDDTPFGLITVAPNLGLETGDTKLLIKEIRAQTAPLGWDIGAIVVDTLSRALAGADENAAADMGRFVRNIDHVSKAFHCLGIAVHHTGKDAERGMRGSSALHGAADAEWEISSDESGKTIRTAKQKDGVDNLLWRFALFPSEIGKDEDQENVSSCVVKLLGEVKQEKKGKNVSPKKPKGQKAELLKAVTKAVDAVGAPLPASNHMPAHTYGVTRDGLHNYAEMLGFMDGKSERVQRSTLDRLLRDLAGDGYIGRWGKHVWLIHDETSETS